MKYHANLGRNNDQGHQLCAIFDNRNVETGVSNGWGTMGEILLNQDLESQIFRFGREIITRKYVFL